MERNEYTLEFLPAALNDMSEIVGYFAINSKKGALRIHGKMIDAAERIERHPYSGVTVPDKKLAGDGYRMAVIENYLMFYKVFENERRITVYRFINGKRDYPALFRSFHETS